MTRQELIDRVVGAEGMKMLGDNMGISFLFPFALVDLAYTEYNKVIRGLPLKGEIKRLRNMWTKENEQFYKDFFYRIGVDAEDEVIDMFDEFESKMEDLVLVIRIQIMNAISDIPFEHQKVIAAAQFCNIMYQEANNYYREKHKRLTPLGVYNTAFLKCRSLDNNYFVRARSYSRRFSQMYYAPFKGAGAVLGEHKKLVDAVGALENRLRLMIREYGCTVDTEN